jgi:predicted deacetylase
MHREAAQYILRFDDLCPTVSAGRWRQCVELIEEFALQPILAVVPDNRDPLLEVSPPQPGFWDEMRDLEHGGAAIALHGYRHTRNSNSAGLLPLNRSSEFAGIAFETQRDWIRQGLKILRDHGLNPRLWVAPWHSFDRSTLAVLREEGISALSDGFARVPVLRGGLVWIPQQLWAPMEMKEKLWTICLHPNTMESAQVDAMRSFLGAHGGQFTSVERALKEFPAAPAGFLQTLREKRMLWSIQASRAWGRTRVRRSNPA